MNGSPEQYWMVTCGHQRCVPVPDNIGIRHLSDKLRYLNSSASTQLSRANPNLLVSNVIFLGRFCTEATLRLIRHTPQLMAFGIPGRHEFRAGDQKPGIARLVWAAY